MASIDKPFFFNAPYRAAFLASMAGRLKDIISEEGSKMLKNKGLTTPATDVSFVLYLSQYRGATIADIAHAQGFSHQRVASRIQHLEKLDLVVRKAIPQDQRCKAVFLTEQGEREALELEAVYHSAAQALEALFEELGDDLMEKLQQAISALSHTPLSQRVAAIS